MKQSICKHKNYDWVTFNCAIKCRDCGAWRPCMVGSSQDGGYEVTVSKYSRWKK